MQQIAITHLIDLALQLSNNGAIGIQRTRTIPTCLASSKRHYVFSDALFSSLVDVRHIRRNSGVHNQTQLEDPESEPCHATRSQAGKVAQGHCRRHWAS